MLNPEFYEFRFRGGHTRIERLDAVANLKYVTKDSVHRAKITMNKKD